MPKLKTHKGAQKRFHVTGGGKIMRMKQGISHLRRNKEKRTKRLFGDTILLSPQDRARIRKLLPYGVR